MKKLNYDPCWLGTTERSKSAFGKVYVEPSSPSVISAELLDHFGCREIVSSDASQAGVVVCFRDRLPASLQPHFAAECGPEGFHLRQIGGQLVLAADDGAGLLYGLFALKRRLDLGETVSDHASRPACALRMINHSDNMNHEDHMGSVERGYAGKSIFFRNFDLSDDLGRIEEYARLLASIGINAVSINNVNVHALETRLITSPYLQRLRRITEIFERYFVKVFLAVNFASPITLGDLKTCDPLDGSVRAWWTERARTVYEHLPHLGGFLVKADSEGRPGPFTYGRSHADGANMLAEAVAPFGGIVIWRCFVYNCQQDWRDRKTDRARAAYDHFAALDGQFSDNVILQIKNGPMDFQVREAVSPLLGAMPNTNCLLELQITQEYTGQQIHVCYLAKQWKEILDFDTQLKGPGSTIGALISGRLNPTRYNGIAAVSNIGDDFNWCGHQLAQANFYSYGRLAWDPSLSAEALAAEWTRLTFGPSPKVGRIVTAILDSSWATYESYTAPLGVGWMVNPSHHYGPNVDGYEYDRWGTYHFADCHGIGVDRSEQGTGFVQQYHPSNRDRFGHADSCPDELALFFHHLPYTHRLHSGKSVIQHIYDTHFAGVEAVNDYIGQWNELKGEVADTVFEHVKERLVRQLASAMQWRDIVNTYFLRKSGIADEQQRQIY